MIYIVPFIYYLIAKIRDIKPNVQYTVLIIILILISGLRWDCGTDWDAYLYYYNSFRGFDESGSLIFSEPGFEFINRLFRSLSMPYTIYLIICAMPIVFWGILLYKFDKCSPIALLSFFSVTYIGFLGGIRQALAVGFMQLAIYLYLYKDKKYLSMLFIIIAWSFHKSALIGFAIYIIPNKLFNINIYIIAILTCWFFSDDIAKLLSANTGDVKFDTYSGNSQVLAELDYDFRDLYLKCEKLGLFLLGYLVLKKEKEKEREIKEIKVTKNYGPYYFNLFVISILIFIIFCDNYRNIAGRLPIYFKSGECLCYVLIVNELRTRICNWGDIIIVSYLMIRAIYIFIIGSPYYYPYTSVLW